MISLIEQNGKLLFEIFSKGNIKRLKTKATIWEISRQSVDIKIFDQCRKVFIEMILKEFPNSCLDYTEDPIRDGLKGAWERGESVGRNKQWKIPLDIDLDEFYYWLDCGDWFIYNSSKCDGPPAVLFFTNIITLEKYFEDIVQKNLPFCLHSQKDNFPWRIIINHLWKE